ncbi:membrane glycosyltransferase [Rivibacter subsaxonicus]|uniref:Glucans biosynthesis glucosyltransferase H n=2 Tax=Rivibacter subsaxonicus TaxID=457575 RepID=A0A4Q7V9S3_9BURK|nr:membrane glycosyltransferase [Rivibacter subsaxonicus]
MSLEAVVTDAAREPQAADLRHRPAHRERARSAPPLLRGAMTPRPWRGFWPGLAITLLALLLGRDTVQPLAAPWAATARRRRRALLALVVGSAALATSVLWLGGMASEAGLLAWLQVGLFALLFAWIAAGCVTALMGYRALRRGDVHALAADDALDAGAAIDAGARTAILMPICNEDVATWASGLRATIESLRASGQARHFEVFILSDTSRPELRAAELAAWLALRETLGSDDDGIAGRLHYRWRQRRTKRKAGNVMDFCRRWGRAYRYMVVLDADSVMSGETLVAMLRLMESQPRVGILQTLPRGGGLDTLHARAQAFAGRVTGRLFSAGLSWWQLGESHYWGHNAMLRVAPFMRHCALARLPGNGGLGGEILSHDFVEAALMRRAGFEVWLVPALEGSYEQQPPHLIDELQRDRRWCQGNLQNARLVAEPGLAGVHRAMFVTGALSYAASPLWLAFVLLGAVPWLAGSSTAVALDAAALPWATLALWGLTLAMLLLPRVLGVALVLQRGEQSGYGGGIKLVGSALAEALLSALQAPVRMLAHSSFVLSALTGLKLQWISPSRTAADVGWREAASRFGLVGALVAAGLAWGLAGEPSDAWRVAPLALPLLLAVPLAVMTSRASIGRVLRDRGWLLVPEEAQPPLVLRRAGRYARELAAVDALAPLAGGKAPVAAARPLAWQRGLSLASLALAGLFISAAPRGMGHAELSAHVLETQRIVMLATSPQAEARVLPREKPRLQRVAASSQRATRQQAQWLAPPRGTSDSPI